ncbi:MAG: hypothetical protein ACPHCI_08665 [Solirubrobacterales bacterium]
MSTVHTPSIELQEPDFEAIAAWVPDDAIFQVFLEHDRDTWYAVSVDFNIPAMSDSLRGVMNELGEALAVYFSVCMSEGKTFEQSRQVIPFRRRFEYRAKAAASRLRHRLPFDGDSAQTLSVPAPALHVA